MFAYEPLRSLQMLEAQKVPGKDVVAARRAPQTIKKKKFIVSGLRCVLAEKCLRG